MFSFNMFPIIPRPFNTQYYCFSVAMLPGNEREDVERGGKIIMPPSALDHLTRLNINYPMLFKLTNTAMDRVTHCGVLEFVAGEGKVYLPHWMMRNLMLDEGGVIQVESVSLPVATFSRFQPQSPEFLDISNPKAVLENCLRNFACLTSGDVVNIKYNQKDYELSVLETQPGEAVSIIECDMNVEFAPPLGYQEPTTSSKNSETTIDPVDLMPEPDGFVKFRGDGYRTPVIDDYRDSRLGTLETHMRTHTEKKPFVCDRCDFRASQHGVLTKHYLTNSTWESTHFLLDGKRKRMSESEAYQGKIAYSKGIPDYEWKVGTLNFIRNIRLPTEESVEDDPAYAPFSGDGITLTKPK